MIAVVYFILMNILGFASMGIDKWKAKHNKYRISERTLFLLAIFGGSIGSIAGMNFFRHKTKHTYFVIGMPLICVIQIAVAVFLYKCC